MNCGKYGCFIGKKGDLISGNSWRKIMTCAMIAVICIQILIPMKAIIIGTALMLSATLSSEASNGLSSNKFVTVKPAAAQQEIGYFRIHRMANDVALSWAITNPAEVTCFSIERSFDGVNFYQIDEVGCDGSPTQKYRDNTAFPGYLYYRITVKNNDGTSVTSATEMIRIVSRRG